MPAQKKDSGSPAKQYLKRHKMLEKSPEIGSLSHLDRQREYHLQHCIGMHTRIIRCTMCIPW